MTINSLQVNESTVVAGLGTQTFNVVTAGLYTLEFKCFLPYQAAGSPAVTTNPSPNVTDVTIAADTAGNKNNKWWIFYTAGNLRGYYVWYNINAAGTDPAVAGLTGIEVAGATGATATTLGGATRTAVAAAVSAVTVSGATSHCIITQNNPGTLTAAANAAGGDSAGASFSVTAAGSYGVPAISGLDVVVSQGSIVLARVGYPSPTQPILGGSVRIQASAADVITVVLSSLSTADAALNAVKSIINLYQGE